ncbi:hypothetical protein [Methylobacterium nigriterrae]|uniref:hypothetical protein n=1 Tax=Methylobacterium nigriterrae TaxID=3127512 RepID=UPI0030135BD5
MLSSHLIRAAAAASLFAPLPILAQRDLRGPADETGTGGGPQSTITAPYTNSLGVTKPPGTSLGPGETPPRAEERRERKTIDGIEGSICRGC